MDKPTILVIFGATGDLMEKKIAPALFNLFKKQKLPKLTKIIGFARRKLTDEEFRDRIKSMIVKKFEFADSEVQLDSFLKLFSYHSGDFQDKSSFKNLSRELSATDESWKICTNKIFYLSVPPEQYANIFQQLSDTKLTEPCSDEDGWTRVLVEKPFGKNLEDALKLEEMLSKLFLEIQIYRIDHYLAKEMVQNIMAFRFSNDLFEQAWTNKFIEKIDIKVWEDFGVEQRGNFYDGLGALRDVGQNHLLQMLALVTMDSPVSLDADSIREQRAKILATLKTMTLSEIQDQTFRAQYEGYKNIEGVDSDSDTETYFKIKAFLTHPRWRGVPITMDSGKRLGKQFKEIVVTFKHASQCLCPPGGHFQDRVIFKLEPTEGIKVEFWSKKPGHNYEIVPSSLDFMLRENSKRVQYTEEYEKLLIDAIKGDQTLFVSTNEVKSMWAFIDPIIRSWRENQVLLKYYEPDTTDITQTKLRDGSGSKAFDAKEIGVIGLGKMGRNLVRRLLSRGWKVKGYNRTYREDKHLVNSNFEYFSDMSAMVDKLESKKLIWLMVPSSAVDEVLFGKNGLMEKLKPGDVVVDGGNSYYKDTMKRAKKLAARKIVFIDVGVSGGPKGALEGPSLMVGGQKKDQEHIYDLISDLAGGDSYQYFDGPGSGHFVKMVHNGIEYGMMQALAEGFTILDRSPFKLDLAKVADIYNHGSVIESRLVGWLKRAFDEYGQKLKNVSGIVGYTGEGEWTVAQAKEWKIKAKIIEESFKFRVQSKKNPDYTGKILTALREQFGGHGLKQKK